MNIDQIEQKAIEFKADGRTPCFNPDTILALIAELRKYEAGNVPVSEIIRDNERLAEENERLQEFMKWLSIQPCQGCAEGLCEGETCSDTSICLTEYCWPCMAKAILKGGD